MEYGPPVDRATPVAHFTIEKAAVTAAGPAWVYATVRTHPPFDQQVDRRIKYRHSLEIRAPWWDDGPPLLYVTAELNVRMYDRVMAGEEAGGPEYFLGLFHRHGRRTVGAGDWGVLPAFFRVGLAEAAEQCGLAPRSLKVLDKQRFASGLAVGVDASVQRASRELRAAALGRARPLQGLGKLLSRRRRPR